MTKPNRQYDATVQTKLPVEKRNQFFSILQADRQMINRVLRNALNFYVEHPEELKRFYSDLPFLFDYNGYNDGLIIVQIKIDKDVLNKLNSSVKGAGQKTQAVIGRMILHFLENPDDMRKFYTEKKD
jgi:hypothetical protein